jgi:hypothetical protein
LFALNIDIAIDICNTNTSYRQIELVVVNFALNVVYHDRPMKKLAPIDFQQRENACGLTYVMKVFPAPAR